MDEITLTFNKTLNVSLQPGDVLFYKDISEGNIYMIGEVQSISGMDIVSEISPATPRPEAGDFIFFAKDSEINTSGILGYYASVKMRLTGAQKKELFAVSTEVVPSS